MRSSPILSLTVVTDDETGMYTMGELDFSIHVGAVEDYLKRNGHQGYKDMLFMMGVLTGKVTEYFWDLQKQTNQAQCAQPTPQDKGGE